MANSEESQRPPSNSAAGDATGPLAGGNPWRDALVLFLAAGAACVLGYLALAVPGAWFPGASPLGWTARELVLARGSGGLADDELVITAIDASGAALVTVETDFRSSDYRAIAWTAIDVPAEADVRMVWRSDYAPAKLNSIPLAVVSGRLVPVSVAKDPAWIGRIRGLALAIVGPLPKLVRIRGVVAKPMGAFEVAGDRVREWLAFEGFTGTSINNVTGGADVQELPLPVLMAVTIALAGLVAFGVARWRRRVTSLPSVLAALFVVAWLVVDARWTWDLARQVRETTRLYAGLDWRERHLAAEDGPLFAFISDVRARLPSTPVRIFMSADEAYLRGRGAYHLYPHNVFFDPYRNTIPASVRMRSGDYFVVYQRRGVQFDAATQRLRWDGGEPVDAEALLTAPGAALFRIR